MKEILALIAISCLLVRDMYAQPPADVSKPAPPNTAQIFQKMDVNRDGKLSKAEVKAPLAQDFDKVDRNRDGFLSAAELEQMPAPAMENRRKGPPNTAQLFQKMDVNKDGRLSKTEVKGPLVQDFDKIDQNKDGMLSRQELQQAPPPPRRSQGKSIPR